VNQHSPVSRYDKNSNISIQLSGGGGGGGGGGGVGGEWVLFGGEFCCVGWVCVVGKGGMCVVGGGSQVWGGWGGGSSGGGVWCVGRKLVV